MSLESGSSESGAGVPNKRVIDDPVAIRAMAHPLRLKLRELVGREGSVTAAQAARELGVSQALASHHLRQLAKYGFVEQAPAADNRERPWRITFTSYSWEPTVATSTAADLLEQLVAQRALDQLADWQRRRGGDDTVWRDNTGLGQSLLYLTADEMVELRRALDALIEPLVARRPIGDPSALPAGARPVDLTIICTPLPPTASGG
ncbi:helix-turn-helix domain-containing protein [Dactylosporangium sp. AC04546]|uniref:helix-turn-helix domain-containing protein n=1 Tax=Dactylosporangium sp. AC04546 TaxID=2862460 RepID=UPI001EE08986|nr:helix-turn-helix domain-containing protein [Dactylosporangium sp. AC04546]WVK79918.1 helix-turn-helix domain-containing protein [Dactylosporangium sp. AC04546]